MIRRKNQGFTNKPKSWKNAVEKETSLLDGSIIDPAVKKPVVVPVQAVEVIETQPSPVLEPDLPVPPVAEQVSDDSPPVEGAEAGQEIDVGEAVAPVAQESNSAMPTVESRDTSESIHRAEHGTTAVQEVGAVEPVEERETQVPDDSPPGIDTPHEAEQNDVVSAQAVEVIKPVDTPAQEKVDVAIYLSKEISSFASATANTPNGMLTIGEFLDDCRTGKYREQIDAIRAEPDKKRRNALKEELPAVTIQSEACTRRGKEFCKSNAVALVDMDGIEDVTLAKQIVSAITYVFAVAVSASEKGLFALCALAEAVADLKPILAKMQKDFVYPIDTSGSDISRLRFVSYDTDLVLKQTVIPFRLEGEVQSDDLADDVHATTTQKQNPAVVPSARPPKKGNPAFDWFVESGEWRKHLGDLEATGFSFPVEKDGVLYLQTPDGDHSPGKQDGNIKDGVVYFHSKAPAPFEVKKGYSIPQLFAGALFGDISKNGLAKVAKRYLRTAQDVPEKIGILVLDSFLERVEQVDFSEDEKITTSTFYVWCIVHLLKLAKALHWDIGMKNEAPHFFNGEFWQRIDPQTFRYFLQAVGVKQGIPRKTIRDHLFVDKLLKQFASEARFPVLSANNTPKINLRNGAIHFTPNGTVLKPFDKQDGLTYRLDYDYDPSATAPLFEKFLDRVLPDKGLRKLIFQYIGYVFLPHLNLEKILFLFGGGANGKSVLLNVIIALIGPEQCCEYSLEGLTGSEYQRAMLGNFLLNVSTETSTRLGADMFKKLASREALPARHPYGRPFNVKDYATSIFAMNELPKEVEQTDGFFRRFAVVPFDVRIPDDEQNPNLAREIIESEMSGVLNYVIEGVESLVAEGTFDIPPVVRGMGAKFRQDSDSVLAYLEEGVYKISTTNWKPLKEMYTSYREFCQDGGYRPVSKTTFSQRLRNLGYTVEKVGHAKRTVVYTEWGRSTYGDSTDGEGGEGGTYNTYGDEDTNYAWRDPRRR